MFNHPNSYTYSSQPPLARTGALGELSCASAGCHSGAANAGPGSVTITPDFEAYVPGETYNITVLVDDDSKSRFGFEVMAVDNEGNSVGAFTADTGNFINVGESSSTGREYAHHFNLPLSTDNSYVVEWTAPDDDMGEITFYAAGVAANAASGPAGDNVYTNDSGVFEADPGIGINDLAEAGDMDILVFPNPVVSDVNVRYQLHSTDNIQIALFDLKGQMLQSFYSGTQNAGAHQMQFDVAHEQLTPGLYIIRVMGNEHQVSRKLSIR